MGDRAQVKLLFEDNKELYFYTHWNGYVLPETVCNALIRGKGRWDDHEYLARIIFSEMIQDEILDETGYGIGFWKHGDLGYPVIEVDMPKNIMKIPDKGEYPFDQLEKLKEDIRW
jgi:hypothetical protein